MKLSLEGERCSLLRAAFGCISMAASLALHAGAAAAVILWFEPKPGAIPIPTDAITVEIIASEVIEVVQPVPRADAAAAASSAQSEAGSTHEAAAQQPQKMIEPPAAEPIKEEVSAKADHAPIVDAARIQEAPAVAPVQEAEPRRETTETVQGPAQERATAKLDEALDSATLPPYAPPTKPYEAEGRHQPTDPSVPETPAAIPTRDTVLPRKEPKEEVVRRKSKTANTPSRKGGAQSRAERASKSSAAHASASAGSAINYAAIVRARVASRRPPGPGRQGTVIVTFGVGPTGGLAFASISRSSGDPILDSSVLAAVRSAAPFPAPPSGASQRGRQFSMPFHFQ